MATTDGPVCSFTLGMARDVSRQMAVLSSTCHIAGAIVPPAGRLGRSPALQPASWRRQLKPSPRLKKVVSGQTAGSEVDPCCMRSSWAAAASGLGRLEARDGSHELGAVVEAFLQCACA